MLQKIYRIIGITALALMLSIGIGFSSKVQALMTPTVSATYAGSGDNVTLSIVGDPNAIVYLNYSNASGNQSTSIGSTNSSGNFSTTLSAASYGITPGNTFDVTVDGIHSLSTTWPSSGSSSTISFSPTTINIGLNQTNTVTITNSVGGSLYIGNNTSSSVANVTLSGNQLSITGTSYGSTTVTVCSSTNSNSCGSIVITVSANGTGNTLTFSPSSVNIGYQQSVPITISGGTGNYIITNNSNASAVNASINGSTLTLYGTSTTGGSSNLTICSSNTTNCSTFTVTLNGSTNNNLVLGQTSITLSPGQTYNVPISGNGTYTIFGNTNSSIASGSISGNSIIGSALAGGSTTVTICQNGTTTCAPLLITVTGTQPSTQTLGATLNLMVGETISMSFGGGSMPYAISSLASPTISPYLSGNTLTVRGVSQGQSSLNICATAGGCATLNFNVIPGTVSNLPPVSTGGYTFTLHLQYGSRGTEVAALQQKLAALGMFSGTIDGDFGGITQAAVQRFQASKGLSADGVVGPGTRAALNAS
jgi:hypothetical protein